jgi:hypothetical protein
MKDFSIEGLLPLPSLEDFSATKELSSMTDLDLLLDVGFTKGFISRFDLAEWLHRVMIVHWVIKKRFNTRHKIPLKKKYADTYKSMGTLYADVYRACERLHSFTNGKYRNAAHYFGMILKEQRVEGLNLGTKRATLDGIKRENSYLSRGDDTEESPFDPIDFPHTYEFFRLLIAMSNRNDILRKEVFEPLKKSRKAWATDYHKNPENQIGIYENGREYRQMPGRGSGKRELKPLCDSREMETIYRFLSLAPAQRNDLLESLRDKGFGR